MSVFRDFAALGSSPTFVRPGNKVSNQRVLLLHYLDNATYWASCEFR